MSRRNESVKKEFNAFMRNRESATYVPPNALNSSYVPQNPLNSSDRPTRPSEVASSRVDRGRVAQLERDHEVLKGGFNKLHAKFTQSLAKVSALETDLHTVRQECADLGHMVRNAEYEARVAKEDAEAAKNEIPQKVLIEIADSVKCNICLDLPVVPFSTDCRHVFCGLCLAESFRSSGNVCPECRSVCGNEPKRDFALRGIIRLLCTLQGREEPSATSTNFNLGLFSQMYREERERRRLQDELRRQHQQQAQAYQVPDVEMINGVEVIIVDNEGPNWDFTGGAQGAGDNREEAEEVVEEL